MTVDALKDAIAALTQEQRHSLATWLNEFEYDDWDRQMARDFAPGGRGQALVERVRRDISCRRIGALPAALVNFDHRTLPGLGLLRRAARRDPPTSG